MLVLYIRNLKHNIIDENKLSVQTYFEHVKIKKFLCKNYKKICGNFGICIAFGSSSICCLANPLLKKLELKTIYILDEWFRKLMDEKEICILTYRIFEIKNGKIWNRLLS